MTDAANPRAPANPAIANCELKRRVGAGMPGYRRESAYLVKGFCTTKT